MRSLADWKFAHLCLPAQAVTPGLDALRLSAPERHLKTTLIAGHRDGSPCDPQT
jgi:hypothetical protein